MCFKRERMSWSSSSLGYNEDMVAEISLYLPVKSILRFQSVSKKWHSILTHTHFFQRYASNKSRTSSLFFESPSSDYFKFLPLKVESNSDFDFDFASIKNSSKDFLLLRNECHGLILFHIIRTHNQPREYRFYICNPSTRKYTKLAIPDSITKAPGPVFSNLAFDPSKSPHYKVIFFWNDRPGSSDEFHITIYSSETRTCKTLGYTFFNKYYSMSLHYGVFLNGAIHWVTCYYPKTTSTSSIFYFDINQETLKAFPGPPNASHPNFFGACRGRLYLILSHREHAFDVFELKEDYSSWFVKYKVDLHAIAAYFPEILIINDEDNSKQYSNPLFCCLLEKHEEEDLTLVLTFAKHCPLIAYNLIDKTAKKLLDLSFDDAIHISWWLQLFIALRVFFAFEDHLISTACSKLWASFVS